MNGHDMHGHDIWVDVVMHKHDMWADHMWADDQHHDRGWSTCRHETSTREHKPQHETWAWVAFGFFGIIIRGIRESFKTPHHGRRYNLSQGRMTQMGMHTYTQQLDP